MTSSQQGDMEHYRGNDWTTVEAVDNLGASRDASAAGTPEKSAHLERNQTDVEFHQ